MNVTLRTVDHDIEVMHRRDLLIVSPHEVVCDNMDNRLDQVHRSGHGGPRVDASEHRKRRSPVLVV